MHRVILVLKYKLQNVLFYWYKYRLQNICVEREVYSCIGVGLPKPYLVLTRIRPTKSIRLKYMWLFIQVIFI